MLKDIIEQIKTADKAAHDASIARFDVVAKPVGSLGELEELLARIAAICGSPEIDIGKKCVLVFCADNGIVSRGVAQSDHSVTAAIARMLAAGRASVCVMAKTAGADVFPRTWAWWTPCRACCRERCSRHL
jgi:nicotinate-nucleotide--dimethylbenzimidazole phosphoribosyltransferase